MPRCPHCDVPLNGTHDTASCLIRVEAEMRRERVIRDVLEAYREGTVVLTKAVDRLLKVSFM